jgi:cytochrome c551/c552
MKWLDRNVMLVLVACVAPTMALADDVGLYKKKGCAGCHGGLPDVELIKEANAPFIDEVAKKYRGKVGVEQKILEEIINKTCKTAEEKDCHPQVKITKTERLRLIRFMLSR